jgi:hypothetical protein
MTFARLHPAFNVINHFCSAAPLNIAEYITKHYSACDVMQKQHTAIADEQLKGCMFCVRNVVNTLALEVVNVLTST